MAQGEPWSTRRSRNGWAGNGAWERSTSPSGQRGCGWPGGRPPTPSAPGRTSPRSCAGCLTAPRAAATPGESRSPHRADSRRRRGRPQSAPHCHAVAGRASARLPGWKKGRPGRPPCTRWGDFPYRPRPRLPTVTVAVLLSYVPHGFETRTQNDVVVSSSGVVKSLRVAPSIGKCVLPDGPRYH